METLALDALRQMLALTQGGILRWSEVEGDYYEASAGDETFSVQFVRFQRTDDVGCDRVMAEIHICGLRHDYCIGTEGFDLANEMLSFSDPRWSESRREGRERFEKGMQRLRSLAISEASDCR